MESSDDILGDTNLTATEEADLRACLSAEDWSRVTKGIRDARSGNYPDDWWDRVMTSGLSLDVWGRIHLRINKDLGHSGQ